MEANTAAEKLFSIPLAKEEGHEERKSTKDMSRTRSLNCRCKIGKLWYNLS